MNIPLHIRYWLPIPLLLIGAGVYTSQLVIPVHDTYFVGHRLDMSIILSLILFISGLGYLFLKFETNQGLRKSHGWFTVIGFILAIAMYIAKIKLDNQWNSKALDYSYLKQADQILTGEIGAIGLILFGFVLYIYNVTWTFFKP